MNKPDIHLIKEYFDASRTGFWKMEKENGSAGRLYGDKNMLELLGVSEDMTPEECYDFFQSHVYPEDYSLMSQYDEELAKGNAEVIYRYLHPQNGLIYIRCGGRISKSTPDTMTFVGFHKELADTVHIEDGKKALTTLFRRNRDMQLEKSQAYYRSLMDSVACGIVEYTLYDNLIQYANAEMLRIFGVKDLNEFQENIHDFFRSTSYSDLSVVPKLRKLQEEDGSVDFEGTVAGLDGRTRNILGHIEAVTSPQGERSVFSTFLDITENRALRSDKHIFDTLSKDYMTFFFIDFKKKKIFSLKKNQKLNEVEKLPEADFEVYDKNFKHYYEESVDKNSAPDFLNKLSLISMEKELETNPIYTYRFNTNERSQKHHFEVFVSKAEGIDAAAVMGFRLIDDIIAVEEEKSKQLEQEHRLLKEQNQIINGLSREYSTVWYISQNGHCNIKYQDNRTEKTKKEDTFSPQSNISYEAGMKEYIEQFVCEEDKEEFARKIQYDTVIEEIRKQPVYSVVYGRLSNGEKHYFQVSFALTDKNKIGTDFVMGYKNIDDVVMTEKQKNEELALALGKAKEASTAKTQFLNNMSHDIRTPMNAILGYANLIKNEQDAGKRATYQEKLEQAGNLLLSIINNVLDMARIESGKAELDEDFTEIGSISKNIAEIFEGEAAKKGIKYILDTSIKPKYVMCDSTKIREIYSNLMSNAIKYTPRGGSITLRLRELPCEKEGFVRIQSEVIDTGIGMSKEFINILYDAFAREKNTTVGKIAGTGLGMAIVKKYMDMMGAEIKVESEQGKGTHYTLIFEHKLADKAYYEDSDKNLCNPDILSLIKGKHILLAEDNELNSEIAIAILKDMGLNVELVDDGIQCVNKVETMPAGSYDLILMDIMMPNMDGYKATQHIRSLKDKQKAGIPIVAMTANAFAEDRKRALESGMNEHISKPVEVKKMERILLNILGESHK